MNFSKKKLGRTRIPNKFVKDRFDKNEKRYTKKINFCTEIINTSITNNKTPLKIVRFFVSEEDRLYMAKSEDYLKL